MLIPDSIIPSNRFGVVYVVTNLANGRQYVGQTVKTTQVRWTTGHLLDAKYRPKYPVHKAIAKYGEDQFTVETIDWAMSQEELDHKESFWITFLDTMADEWGYNLKGGGAPGSPCQEVRDRISRSLTGRKLPVGHPFTIKGKPCLTKGRPQGEAQKMAHSILMKVRYASGEMVNPRKGKAYPEARRAVICVETGQLFDSRRLAAHRLVSDKNKGSIVSVASGISLAIRTGTRAYGFHWKDASNQLKESLS